MPCLFLLHRDLGLTGHARQQLGNAYENESAAFRRYRALLQPVSRDKLTQAYAAVASAQARLVALQAGQTPEQQQLAKAQLDQARANLARVCSAR